MKRCFRCGHEKPLDLFYKHSRMADGRLNKCIECTKADVAAHRLANLQKVRSYDKARASLPHRIALKKRYAKTAAYAESHKAAVKRWEARHPERKRASTAVRNAIRDGKLKKLPCEVCGREKSEAHHPHYDFPMLVVWLCSEHHREVHRMQFEALAETF